jgi:hypothetical protein
MTTSHTPGLGSSFELALIDLEENSISAAGVRAIKICNAADDLLAALQSIDPLGETQMTHQYIASIKQGRARVGIAGVNLGPDSCIASAAKVFQALGVNCSDVGWGDYVSACKNYKPGTDFLSIPDAVAATEFAADQKRIAEYLASL